MQLDYFSSLALDRLVDDNEMVTYAATCKQLTRKKVRSSSVYRMASSFELGDEQNFRKNDLKDNDRHFGKLKKWKKMEKILTNGLINYSFSEATYQHLFGPPTPVSVRRMKNKKFYGDDIPNIRKSKKPLPGTVTV